MGLRERIWFCAYPVIHLRDWYYGDGDSSDEEEYDDEDRGRFRTALIEDTVIRTLSHEVEKIAAKKHAEAAADALVRELDREAEERDRIAAKKRAAAAKKRAAAAAKRAAAAAAAKKRTEAREAAEKSARNEKHEKLAKVAAEARRAREEAAEKARAAAFEQAKQRAPRVVVVPRPPPPTPTPAPEPAPPPPQNADEEDLDIAALLRNLGCAADECAMCFNENTTLATCLPCGHAEVCVTCAREMWSAARTFECFKCMRKVECVVVENGRRLGF